MRPFALLVAVVGLIRLYHLPESHECVGPDVRFVQHCGGFPCQFLVEMSVDDAVNHQGDSREYQCYQNGRGGSVVEGYAVAQAHGFSGDRMM